MCCHVVCAKDKKVKDVNRYVELVLCDPLERTSEVRSFEHGYYSVNDRSNLLGENIIHILFPSQVCSKRVGCRWCTELVKRVMSRSSFTLLEEYIK